MIMESIRKRSRKTFMMRAILGMMRRRIMPRKINAKRNGYLRG